MDSSTLQILIAMVCYMLVVIGIGVFFMRKSNESSNSFLLGGRTLGPWITAMSAEASDMSGWLLMGLPGVAYWCGLSDAFWTALGLALGTYLNWLLVAKRLRNYSVVANDSVTLPDFFSNRFREKKKILMTLSALFILIFFTVYASSCFVTCGKLFSTLFGFSYVSMMIVGAVFVVLYTLLGGFLAESASDFMQAIVMIIALAIILVLGTGAAGGVDAVTANAKNIPGFLDFFGIASPTIVDGVQQSANGAPLFGEAGSYGLITIISTMAWGLGYFGMPQVLLRFMAVDKAKTLVRSRRIATVWVLISLAAATLIGIVGRAAFPTELTTASEAESIFIVLSKNLLPPLVAGIILSGILAATISSSDSYMLIAASAVSKNIFAGLFKKDATDKQILNMTRIMLAVIAVIAVVIALDENSVIFTIVSFAWAGFGATFGPLVLFSLFWKRMTYPAAIAGMVSGGVMVFVWKLLVRPMGGVLNIYELLPAFLISSLVIIVVSLCTKKPDESICRDFELAKGM